MCGRYSMYESMDHYLRQLSLDLVVINGYDQQPINRYNIAPSTHVELLRQVDGGLSVDRVKWGWSPFWAKASGIAPINARAETVVSGKFFEDLWPGGRALAPANGWFEWIPDQANPKQKQPYYITAVNDEPLYFAALAEVHQAPAAREQDGFVIITAAADQGLVDIHDRKPLVFTPEAANEWLDPATPPARAAEMMMNEGREATYFRWYPVSKAVGNVRNEGSELIAPVRVRTPQGRLEL